MPDLRASAASVSTAAFLVMASSSFVSTPVIRVVRAEGPQNVRVLSGNVVAERYPLASSASETPVDGVDFSEMTEADMAMLRHAMTSGADETDFSEFYIDDDE